jgi:hypothetical protein
VREPALLAGVARRPRVEVFARKLFVHEQARVPLATTAVGQVEPAQAVTTERGKVVRERTLFGRLSDRYKKRTSITFSKVS